MERPRGLQGSEGREPSAVVGRADVTALAGPKAQADAMETLRIVVPGFQCIQK